MTYASRRIGDASAFVSPYNTHTCAEYNAPRPKFKATTMQVFISWHGEVSRMVAEASFEPAK
jgi:hypothetical protein